MSKLLNQSFGSVNLTQINVSPKVSVTQGTNLGTTVTINSPSGWINTGTTTLATQGSTTFTCSNNCVNTSKMVIATIQGYTGTVGSPAVYVKSVANGNFTLTVQNRDQTNALNGSIKIGYVLM